MKLFRCSLETARRYPTLHFTGKARINTQIIKQYQKQLQKNNSKSSKQYPLTFQQKMIIVNDPKTVQLLEIVEYGVKYKEGRIWWPILLIGAGLLGYLFQKILPIRVNDRYFTISPQSPSYVLSYLFSPFNFEKPFYLYLPAMLGIYQLSRFISIYHFWGMLIVNCIIGNIFSQYEVNKRVSKYEMWENYSMSFGEGNLLSFLFSFWSYIGFKQAFTHLKSKLFLEVVRGKGIVRRGVPFGYICLIYAALQYFFYAKGAKNSEVVLLEILSGILMGLVLRKIKPILK